VLGEKITVHPSTQGPALGAAILGALAARAFSSPKAAIRAMSVPAPGTAKIFAPDRRHRSVYDALYRNYRRLAEIHSTTLLS
jgi:L-ribulokinase